MSLSAPITIFEGPDGSGKSTAAAAYAAMTQARLVHCGPFPAVGQDYLGRFYVEAMLPALLGYQAVVLDRSWLSEPIYGAVFREGEDRLGVAGRRMLERVALRGGAVVVRCDPGLVTIEETYRARQTKELLNGKVHGLAQLRAVAHHYLADLTTDLPTLHYSYKDEELGDLAERIDRSRSPRHYLVMASAGQMEAKTILVGQDFGPAKATDSFYQWPFVSFSKAGCSRWLTEQLEEWGVPETELFWVNADQLSEMPKWFHEMASQRRVIALGVEAAATLEKHGISYRVINHPQAWKRFNRAPYPLRGLLS